MERSHHHMVLAAQELIYSTSAATSQPLPLPQVQGAAVHAREDAAVTLRGSCQAFAFPLSTPFVAPFDFSFLLSHTIRYPSLVNSVSASALSTNRS